MLKSRLQVHKWYWPPDAAANLPVHSLFMGGMTLGGWAGGGRSREWRKEARTRDCG